MNRKLLYLAIVSFFILIILFLVNQRNNFEKINEQNYSKIVEANISGKVTEVLRSGGFTTLIITEGNIQKSFTLKAKTLYSKSNWSFGPTVEIGDSVYKKANSDSLILISQQFDESCYKIIQQ